jgi:RNA polymerase sigma-70 factor (ECF subfamily)
VPAGQVEDLVAETYARALEALPRYEDRGTPLRAWLLRIALNLVIDAQRSAHTRTVPSDTIVQHVERTQRDRLTDPATEWVDQHDATTRLRAAFTALAPAQRVAVGLRHLEGLPVDETAAVLGVSHEAVRALTYRGLAALRRALSGPSSPAGRPAPIEPSAAATASPAPCAPPAPATPRDPTTPEDLWT